MKRLTLILVLPLFTALLHSRATYRPGSPGMQVVQPPQNIIPADIDPTVWQQLRSFNPEVLKQLPTLADAQSIIEKTSEKTRLSRKEAEDYFAAKFRLQLSNDPFISSETYKKSMAHIEDLIDKQFAGEFKEPYPPAPAPVIEQPEEKLPAPAPTPPKELPEKTPAPVEKKEPAPEITPAPLAPEAPQPPPAPPLPETGEETGPPPPPPPAGPPPPPPPTKETKPKPAKPVVREVLTPQEVAHLSQEQKERSDALLSRALKELALPQLSSLQKYINLYEELIRKLWNNPDFKPKEKTRDEFIKLLKNFIEKNFMLPSLEQLLPSLLHDLLAAKKIVADFADVFSVLLYNYEAFFAASSPALTELVICMATSRRQSHPASSQAAKFESDDLVINALEAAGEFTIFTEQISLLRLNDAFLLFSGMKAEDLQAKTATVPQGQPILDYLRSSDKSIFKEQLFMLSLKKILFFPDEFEAELYTNQDKRAHILQLLNAHVSHLEKGQQITTLERLYEFLSSEFLTASTLEKIRSIIKTLERVFMRPEDKPLLEELKSEVFKDTPDSDKVISLLETLTKKPKGSLSFEKKIKEIIASSLAQQATDLELILALKKAITSFEADKTFGNKKLLSALEETFNNKPPLNAQLIIAKLRDYKATARSIRDAFRSALKRKDLLTAPLEKSLTGMIEPYGTLVSLFELMAQEGTKALQNQSDTTLIELRDAFIMALENLNSAKQFKAESEGAKILSAFLQQVPQEIKNAYLHKLDDALLACVQSDFRAAFTMLDAFIAARVLSQDNAPLFPGEDQASYEKGKASYNLSRDKTTEMLMRSLVIELYNDINALAAGSFNIPNLSSTQGTRAERKRNAQLYELLKNNQVFKPLQTRIASLYKELKKEGVSTQTISATLDIPQTTHEIQGILSAIKALLDKSDNELSYVSSAQKQEEKEAIAKALSEFLQGVEKKISLLK